MSDNGRWNGIDPLTEKYATLSAYAFVANNPVKAYDPDGKRIFYVNDDGNVQRATRKLLQTLTGGKTIKKYLRSKTEDVYIALTNTPNAGGRTARNAHEKGNGITVNKNGKGVTIDSRVTGDSRTAFEVYKHVDFTRSKGNKIHLVSMDSENAKSSNVYENAEAIFHEINAHIENATGNEKEDHKKYGKTATTLYTSRPLYDPLGNPIVDHNGNQLYESVPLDSPAGKIVRELKYLQQNEKE